MEFLDMLLIYCTVLVTTAGFIRGQDVLLSGPGLVAVHEGEVALLRWTLNETAVLERCPRNIMSYPCNDFYHIYGWKKVNSTRDYLFQVEMLFGDVYISKNNNRTTFFVDNSNSGFFIDDITTFDAGGYGYRITAVSLYNESAVIYVYNEPSQALVSPSFSTPTLSLPFHLTCHAASTSQPEDARRDVTMVYTWKVNGITLTLDNIFPRFRFSSSPPIDTSVRKNQLRIRSLRCGDQGVYTCSSQESGSRLVSDESRGYEIKIAGCSDTDRVRYSPTNRVLTADVGEQVMYSMEVMESVEAFLGISIQCSGFYESKSSLDTTLPPGAELSTEGRTCQLSISSVETVHDGRYTIHIKLKTEVYLGKFELNIVSAPSTQTTDMTGMVVISSKAASPVTLPSGSGPSRGHIGGIVIGVLFLVCLLLMLTLFLLWLKRNAIKDRMDGSKVKKSDDSSARCQRNIADVISDERDQAGAAVYDTVKMEAVKEGHSIYTTLTPQTHAALDKQDSSTYEMVLTEVKMEQLRFGSILHQGRTFCVQRVTHKLANKTKRELVLKKIGECSKALGKCGSTYLINQLDVMRLLSDGKHVMIASAFCRQDTVQPLFLYHSLGSLKSLLDDQYRQSEHAYDNVTIIGSSTSLAVKASLMSSDLPPWRFAIHVAKGLATLHSAKEELLVYEMSAENVILVQEGSHVVAKLSGFASASHIRERRRLEQQENLLSVRWLAPETANELKHTKESDVWGFGVLLWEIASKGEVPYGDMDEYSVKGRVASGKRLNRPQNCDMDMYKMMMSCWRRIPSSRPEARSLVDSLQHKE